MKKIAFALQVFSLIAMFPLCVVLEMNHSTGSLPGNKNHSGVTWEQEKTIIQSSTNSRVQIESSMPGKI